MENRVIVEDPFEIVQNYINDAIIYNNQEYSIV